jgi:hypothetical protein
VLGTCARSPDHGAREEEGEGREDGEGGMVRVDEPWVSWRGSVGAGGRGGCTCGNGAGGVAWYGVEFSRDASSSPPVSDICCLGKCCEMEKGHASG